MKRNIPFPASFSVRKFISALWMVIAVLLFAGLVYSVIQSGYHYQFDVDELFYSQYAYLYAHGLRPYLDVYTSVYPPLFQWIMMPVFWLKGFTFDAIYLGRIVVMAFLAIRLVSMYFLLKTVWSRRTALIFLPLTLLDPFAVFTTMQFRPDNLMFTVFTAALLLFTIGLKQKNRKFIVTSGILFGLSALILTKIIPSLFVVSGFFVWYSLSRKKLKDLFLWIAGIAAAPLLFAGYLATQGSLTEMIIQMFVETKLLYTNFTYPIPINALMYPNNIFIFGTMGKPVTWVYLWLIIPVGLAGAYHVIHAVLEKGKTAETDLIKLMIACSFLVQWAVLFMLQVVFMQHYMPVNFFAAALGAYAADSILTVTGRNRILGTITALLFAGVYISLTIPSIRYNLVRATITGADTMQKYEARWKQIPATEAVFPNFLFRPSLYPIPYGSFIVNYPKKILDRLPSITALLESKKPRLLLDDYTLVRLPPDVQIFVNNHYRRVAGDPELMVWEK